MVEWSHRHWDRQRRISDERGPTGRVRLAARRRPLDRLECPAGSFIHIPAGLRHGFRVGNVPSRKLNLYTLAAMVGYYDELSASIEAGESDGARLDEIAARYGMEVIGPVPEGYL